MSSIFQTTRRTIIRTLLSGALLGYWQTKGQLLKAETRQSQEAPLQEMLENFVGLSQALTELGEVITQNYPDLKTTYLITLLENTKTPYPGQAEALLSLYGELKQAGIPQAEIANLVLNESSEPIYSQLARSIMSMWYLGIWYDPKGASEAFSFISAQTYINGQAWTLAETHPQGFSRTFYGSWGWVPQQGA